MRKINAIPPVIQPEPFVELGLSHEQTEFLFDLLHYVGGPPAGSRGLADQIRRALDAVVERPEPKLEVRGGVVYTGK